VPRCKGYPVQIRLVPAKRAIVGCYLRKGTTMPIMFNTILQSEGLALGDVRLLRHQDQRSDRGRSPYELWRDYRSDFELYQSHQRTERRPHLRSRYWASFVGTPSDETMFVGVYRVEFRGLLETDAPLVIREGVDKAGTCDVYDLRLEEALRDLIGKLFIEWGPATRAWVQRADQQNKAVKELRTEFKEPDFPGFLNFVMPLSKLEALPKGWITTLQSSKGVYLLTCPITKEQYVGSATGEHGFWGRWQCYVQTGHGHNVALKSRSPSDYQMSILEVGGTSSTDDDILTMEKRWKTKLQSNEMGLNRNY
jgi:hypothetical protein